MCGVCDADGPPHDCLLFFTYISRYPGVSSHISLSPSLSGLERIQVPVEEDQMVEEKHGVCVAEVQGGGPGWRQELACSLCKQLFSSLLQLRQHEYSHTLSLMALSLDCLDHHRPIVAASPLNPPPARYHCSQCPASFTLKSNADRHEKTIHLKRKLMQCVYCLKHFRDRTDLNRHLSSVHSSERVYTCPACSRTFSTQKKPGHPWQGLLSVGNLAHRAAVESARLKGR